MGLDITFFGDDPEARELDGQRLTNVPGFMNFVLVLGEVLKALRHDPKDRILYSSYEMCSAYLDKHPESESRFEEYLNFIRKFAARVAQDGGDLAVPLNLDDYDPDARRLSAALMLRDTPIGGTEAREMAGFVSDLLGHSRTMSRLLAMLSDVDSAAIDSMIRVLEKFKRCVDVAAENNVSFEIDF